MSNRGPLRILHVIQRMRPGGVQALVMNVYRHIDRSRVQFDFAVRASQPEHYDEEIRSLGGRIFHLPWSAGNPASVFAYMRAFQATLREFGPFAGLHSHVGSYSGFVLPVAKRVGIPLRVSHSHSASAANTLLRSIWEWVMRYQIRAYATHLLACSELAAERLFGHHWRDDARVQVVRDAIDVTAYKALPDDRCALRKELGLPLKGPLIGHVGRFDPVKNHTFLVKVFAALLKQAPDAHLILVGEGDLRPQVEALVQGMGIRDKVHFLGVRSDVPRILGCLNFFVLPSLSEGLGIVLIEAQAAGVPCLASDVVPIEADVKVGLVQFESLQTGSSQWAQRIKDGLQNYTPPWTERQAALRMTGYDIQDVAMQLHEMYTKGW